MKSQNTICEIFMYEQVSEIAFNSLRSEYEVLILWVSKDVVQQASEGNNEFSNETTNQEYTVFLGMRVSYIVDSNLWVILL